MESNPIGAGAPTLSFSLPLGKINEVDSGVGIRAAQQGCSAALHRANITLERSRAFACERIAACSVAVQVRRHVIVEIKAD